MVKKIHIIVIVRLDSVTGKPMKLLVREFRLSVLMAWAVSAVGGVHKPSASSSSTWQNRCFPSRPSQIARRPALGKRTRVKCS